MRKHLKYYQTQALYNADNTRILPNVSYIAEEDNVQYNIKTLKLKIVIPWNYIVLDDSDTANRHFYPIVGCFRVQYGDEKGWYLTYQQNNLVLIRDSNSPTMSNNQVNFDFADGIYANGTKIANGQPLTGITGFAQSPPANVVLNIDGCYGVTDSQGKLIFNAPVDIQISEMQYGFEPIDPEAK